jgi:hypothetical protein
MLSNGSREKIMINMLFKFLFRQVEKFEFFMEPMRSKRHYSRNLYNVIKERAVNSSADFVEQHLTSSLVFRKREIIQDYTVEKLIENYSFGKCLEFGVATGYSINRISKKLNNFDFYGFDSFEGLVEDWVGTDVKKKAFSQQGRLPKVHSNVTLIKGWFNETLPPFLSENDMSDVRLIHIDSDTYESATIVFKEIGPYLRSGLFILFDELIGYPNWKNGEYKALIEAQKTFGFEYRFLAFTTEQALIEIV